MYFNAHIDDVQPRAALTATTMALTLIASAELRDASLNRR
jgi:hypothetical protein